MSKPRILTVWSNYYKELAQQQLESCIQRLNHLDYTHSLETVTAGTYEIPAVIQYYQRNQPFDAYIPLSLLLKGRTDHYEFIWEHVKTCFSQFAMTGLVFGNGIITAPNPEIMQERVESGARVKEAIMAIDYLIQLKRKQPYVNQS